MKDYFIFVFIFILVLITAFFVIEYADLFKQETAIVGNDADVNGCIGSAGYSWCEAKRQCIRVFEEDCLSQVAIKAALALKYNKPASDILVKITSENTKYARGSVTFGKQGDPGGNFLAAKVDEKWQIIFDGNGSIDCDQIQQTYQFPKSMLTGLCD